MGIMNLMDTVALTARNLMVMVGSSPASDIMSQITGEQQSDMSDITDAVTTTGNGLIYIVMTVVGIAGVLGFLIVALKLMVGGSQTKAEAKGGLLWLVIAAIIGFGAIGIMGLLATMSGTLFS